MALTDDPGLAPPDPRLNGVTAPPHNLEAEQSVLGAILLSERSLYALVIEEGLRPEDFYRERHRITYAAMLRLYAANDPIDPLTVTEALRQSGELEAAGGAAAIDELTASVPLVGNARRYAQIVKENALLRRLLQTTYEIQASVAEHRMAPRDLVEQAEKAMLEVAHDDKQQDFRSIEEILHDELDKMQRLSAEGTALTGTPSGFKDLDEITGGFQPGNLIILAARPSMGKCLRGSTLVADPRTGARRRIDELVEALEAGDEVFVSSLGPDLRLRPARVAAGMRSGIQKLFRLTTKLGRRVDATANHPLLTIRGWRELATLRPGDRIAVPRQAAAARGREFTSAIGRAAGDRSATATHVAVADALAACDVWWDAVASIEYVGEEETYDLTVPGDHNFVADDVIVHNSALVTNIAENAAIEYNRPVALFSLEMSETELAQRFVASQGRIFGDKLRKGRVADSEWPKILEATKKLSAAPLYIDDSSDIGILDIRAKARRLHQQAPGGLGLIIVDYLQLMRPDPGTDSRVEQVGQMSRGLKILARELNVPVIALSQLSRAVEQRHDKKPILSDLRECVTGDTLVQLADGRRTPIRDLVGTTPEVVAVDERGRTVTAASDCVWRVGRRRVLALRLASGRTLRATADHRVRAHDGWRRMETLAPGDRVALARRIPEPTDTVEWPDDHVVLLGQLIGDGSYLPGQPMRYTTASEENSAAVREAAERGFGCTVTRHAGRGSRHQLVISGNGTRWAPAGVNAWLRGLGIFGQRSHEKRIPAEAFRLPDRQIALLLRHLWATDGSIWDGTRASDGRSVRRVAYSTVSPGLASDVAALLLRLGIVARINVSASGGEHRPTHHVLVSGAEAQLRFLETVGTFGPRVAQGERLRVALAGRRATTNVDTLPREAWAGVRTATAAQGVTQRQMAALRGTAYGGAAHFAFAPPRETLLGYAELLDDDALRDAAGSDLFWDRVVAVDDAGEEDVYDLTVPGPACWLADGIVTHNSGQIEQDADLVMFIYRDEYYEKDESEAQGLAEILIAKHRNGGLGDVTLTFRKEYPKFLNYAGERYQ
jgi:replicative DNA helicase